MRIYSFQATYKYVQVPGARVRWSQVRQPTALIRSFLLCSILALLPVACVSVIAQQASGAPAPSPSTANHAAIAANYGRLPLSFEANQGQADPQVRFLSRGNGYSLFLTDRAAVLSLRKPDASPAPEPSGSSRLASKKPASLKTDVVRMELVGASHDLHVTGASQLPGTSNYFIGNDPAKWHSNVPTFARVKYEGVYPGVDLVYYGNQQQLEYDFVVNPGADARSIRLCFAGAKKLQLDNNGDLEVIAKNGRIAFHKPVVYQEVGALRHSVQGSFKLAANTVEFSLGSYDHSKALVIDPTLIYSTFLGGQGTVAAIGGEGAAIAVDSEGNAYVVGTTNLPTFPITSGTLQSEGDGLAPSQNYHYSFVSKINAAGTALLYSTFLGGSGQLEQQNNEYLGDAITSIFVDSTGDAYVAGTARSANFPVTSGAYQTKYGATNYPTSNGFLTKLSPNGSALVYSTYLGGNGRNANGGYEAADVCTQVAVSSSGNAYVVGTAQSADFPTTPGAFQPKFNAPLGGSKAFVAEFNPDGSDLVYSTFVGGSSQEWGNSIALDAAGNAYIAGETTSTDFPFSATAFQNTNYAWVASQQPTGFVAKLNPAGSALAYATYLGGAGSGQYPSPGLGDDPTSIALDSAGDAYVTGVTSSSNFPTKNALQSSNKTYSTTNYPYVYTNSFVTKLNPSGSALIFSTYLGSSGGEVVPGTTAFFGGPGEAVLSATGSIAVDANGNAFITGTSYGSDFPTTTNAFESTSPSVGHGSGESISNQYYGGPSASAWFAQLSSTGSLTYSTYLGGSAFNPQSFGGAGGYVGDFGSGVAIDGNGNAYLSGIAESPDFPVTPGAYLTAKTAQYNAYISKFSLGSAAATTITTILSSLNPETVGNTVKFTAFVQSASGSATPTGTIDFTVDSGTATSEPVDNTGHASFSTNALSDGPHAIHASYSGDSTYSASANSMTEVLAGAPATASVISGGGQNCVKNAFCQSRIVVQVTDANGKPVPNTNVVFGGQNLTYFSFFGNLADYAATGTTDFTGEVSATVMATGVGNLTGTATVNGVQVPAFFQLKGILGYLQVTASSVSVPFGQPIPALTYGVTGFVNGDTSAVLSGAPSETTTAKQGSAAGTYPITITQGTLSAANYAFNFMNGTVTIDPVSSGFRFVPLPPCRVADTRNPAGAFGGPELGAGASREFDLPSSACGIPSTAVAYSLNVTVVPDKILQYLTLWPSGAPQPYVSTLNSYDGRVKANAAITAAGTNGGVSVFVSDASNVILDIDGYFVPATTTSALAFYPLAPCRIADTRNAAGPLGGPFIAANGSRSFPVQSSACNIPSNAQAYSLNVTAVPHTTLDYLTTWPTGQTQPYVSTLNALTGAVTANAAIVPAGTSGAVSFFVSDDADVILDINGYFAPAGTGGLSLYTAQPCRIVDTRSAGGAFNGVLQVPVETSACALPAAAQAYVVNATVVPPGALIYLTLWPDGETQPNVSTLNADDGAITSNLAIVPTSNGKVDAFSSNPTQLILDSSGYFAP